MKRVRSCFRCGCTNNQGSHPQLCPTCTMMTESQRVYFENQQTCPYEIYKEWLPLLQRSILEELASHGGSFDHLDVFPIYNRESCCSSCARHVSTWIQKGAPTILSLPWLNLLARVYCFHFNKHCVYVLYQNHPLLIKSNKTTSSS
jgi:hypothetical protein